MELRWSLERSSIGSCDELCAHFFPLYIGKSNEIDFNQFHDTSVVVSIRLGEYWGDLRI